MKGMLFRKIKSHAFVLTILGVFLGMVVLNRFTPLIADDLQYLYKTEGFSTILKNEYWQYMNWTGRSVVHILARIFLLLPKTVFNILNALAYTYLSLLIYFLSTNLSKEPKLLKYVMINICIWLFVPTFGQVFLWETGSANYLWGSVIILSFLAIYHRYGQMQASVQTWRFTGFMFFMGIAAGWCNENTSGGAIMIAIGYLMLYKWQKRTIPKWMYTGIIGAFLGLFLMIIAPGNDFRATFFERSAWPLQKKILLGILDITQALREQSSTLFLLLAVAIFLFCMTYFHKEKLFKIVLYSVSGLATLYVLAISPTGLSWGRSYYGGILYLLLALFIAWPDHLQRVSKTYFPLYGSMTAMLGVSFVLSFVLGFGDMIHSYQKINERYAYLNQQKNAGNMHPVVGSIDVPNVTSYPAYSNALSHVVADKNHLNNQATAKYFGVTDVAAVSQKDWETIYKNGDPKLMAIQTLQAYLTAIQADQYVVLLSGGSTKHPLSPTLLNDLKRLFPTAKSLSGKNWTLSGIQSTEATELRANQNESELTTVYKQTNLQIVAISQPYATQITAKIVVNGNDVSRNKEGLNFVVLDAKTGKLLDSVSFGLDAEQLAFR